MIGGDVEAMVRSFPSNVVPLTWCKAQVTRQGHENTRRMQGEKALKVVISDPMTPTHVIFGRFLRARPRLGGPMCGSIIILQPIKCPIGSFQAKCSQSSVRIEPLPAKSENFGRDEPNLNRTSRIESV